MGDTDLNHTVGHICHVVDIFCKILNVFHDYCLFIVSDQLVVGIVLGWLSMKTTKTKFCVIV